jgi:hypothetical protein
VPREHQEKRRQHPNKQNKQSRSGRITCIGLAVEATDPLDHKSLSLPDVKPSNSVAQKQEGVSKSPQSRREIIFQAECLITTLRPKTQHGSNLTIGGAKVMQSIRGIKEVVS